MKFWKWYLKGILRTPSALVSWFAEYMYGVVIFTAASAFLSIHYSLLWLILTVPVGVTVSVHGFWRNRKRYPSA